MEIYLLIDYRENNWDFDDFNSSPMERTTVNCYSTFEKAKEAFMELVDEVREGCEGSEDGEFPEVIVQDGYCSFTNLCEDGGEIFTVCKKTVN